MTSARFRVAIVASIGLFVATASAQKKSSPLADGVTASIDHTFRTLASDGDFSAADATLTTLFDQVIAYADDDERALLRDAALARRIVRQLAAVEEPLRPSLLSYLRRNPELAAALAFTMKPSREEPAEVFAVLETLRKTRGERLNEYATLTAALCVVHDKKLTQRVNENRAMATDVVSLFDYFAANEKKMLFGLRNIPASLLIYVVDTTASVQEMRWALGNYAGDTSVGGRFFDIEYDVDHFRTGSKKKVTLAGWSLPNILTYGGVCADQAYFAMTVGKSIGVPTTYAVGRSAEVGHAWVGFLQSNRTRAWWNFDAGRYSVYQGVRGVIIDPQTRRRIPDSDVSLLADFAMAETADREYAAAATDAALRLIELEDVEAAFPAAAPGAADFTVRRRPHIDDELALLESGLRACPGYAAGWLTVRHLGAEGKLSLEQKRRWADVLHRLCGRSYPDFYLAVLEPMIETVDDVNEQNRLWNAAFKAFGHRADLSAHVRLEQGRMWLAAKDPRKAGQCFEDVINRYANAGPFVITALEEAEKLLGEDERRVLMLYDQTWNRTKKPTRMAATFRRQSNWYRIGGMYAKRLTEAGQDRQAASVEATLRE